MENSLSVRGAARRGEIEMLELKHPPGSAEGMASKLGLHQEDALPMQEAIACAQKQQTDKTECWKPEEQHELLRKHNISSFLGVRMLRTACI